MVSEFLKLVAENVPCWCESERKYYKYDNEVNCFRFEGHGKYSNHCLTLNSMWRIYKLRQTEVDELQQLYTQQGLNMFNLQKRVDAVIKIIDETNEEINLRDMPRTYARTQLNRMKSELEQALNGGIE